MNIKIKKENQDGIVRLESSGKVKEIVIKEDFLNKKGSLVSLGFKGKSSSGILELTLEELKLIHNEVSKKERLFKEIKIEKI